MHKNPLLIRRSGISGGMKLELNSGVVVKSGIRF